MTAHDVDGVDIPPLPRGVATAVAFARMEAKLDVAISQQAMFRDETARRLADHDAILARIGDTLAAIQAEQAVAKASQLPRVPPATWVSLGLAILTALYVVIDHA